MHHSRRPKPSNALPISFSAFDENRRLQIHPGCYLLQSLSYIVFAVGQDYVDKKFSWQMPKLLQTEVKSCMACCGLELGYYIGLWYVTKNRLLFYPQNSTYQSFDYIPVLGILKSQGEFYSFISQFLVHGQRNLLRTLLSQTPRGIS